MKGYPIDLHYWHTPICSIHCWGQLCSATSGQLGNVGIQSRGHCNLGMTAFHFFFSLIRQVVDLSCIVWEDEIYCTMPLLLLSIHQWWTEQSHAGFVSGFGF